MIKFNFNIDLTLTGDCLLTMYDIWSNVHMGIFIQQEYCNILSLIWGYRMG